MSADPEQDVPASADKSAFNARESEADSGESDVAVSETSHDTFLEHGPGLAALEEPTPFGDENALQKLGKPPFERSARSKFRLVGYLATVYEHVTEDVGGKTAVEDDSESETPDGDRDDS